MGMGSESRRWFRRAAGPAALAAVCAALLSPASASAEAPGFLYEFGDTGNGPGQFSFPDSLSPFGGGATVDIFVADAENNRIQVLRQENGQSSQFLTQFGALGSGPGQLSAPSGVVTGGLGTYVLDKGNNRVEKFSSADQFVSEWGSQGTGPGQFLAPEGMAQAPNGDIYVADTGNDRVQRFDQNGAFLGAWGTTGSGHGQFDQPDGAAVDASGNVYVADTANDRIQKFNSAGSFLDEWGDTGDGPGEFNLPVAIAIAGGGRLYVADAANDRVEAFTQDGKFLFQFGADGKGPGLFESPLALTVDSNGHVYVADSGNDRVEVFGHLPAPKYGSTFDAGPVDGVVKVKVPGSDGFDLLGSSRELPIGTVIDTDKGRMRLFSAKGKKGGVQSAEFFEGTFKVLQTKGGKPITVLKLMNKVACGKGKKGGKRPTATASRKSRGLWGSGKGNFRSEGRHGSATVEGTIWWAQDLCDGTLFKVKRGVVTVRDFTNHKTVKIHRGQRYLAPAG